MNSKILLLALSAGIFSSCSTSYKSGQTPDDVYYSPVKYTEEKQNDDRDEVKNDEPQKDYEISMTVRDRRWRDFNNEYDYNKSPYYYCNCKCNNYGYYYNPSYHPWPVYIAKIVPVNSTPRMVNLNAYRGYNSNASPGTKPGSGVTWIPPSNSYNNSNTKGNGTVIRRVISAIGNSSSTSNDSRTYSPSSSSSSSGSSNSSSGSVSRPKRGG